jgi:hypothetical protein
MHSSALKYGNILGNRRTSDESRKTQVLYKVPTGCLQRPLAVMAFHVGIVVGPPRIGDELAQ